MEINKTNRKQRTRKLASLEKPGQPSCPIFAMKQTESMQQRLATKEDYQKRINILVEYINNHLGDSIDLTTLADLSGFSPFHFHRIAKAFLGEPVGAFVVRMRVEATARLLRYTDLSVQDIAYRVGYDVPSSLSKVFKQFYGISPNDYRNNKDYTIMKPLHPFSEIKLKAPKLLELEPKQAIYIRLSGAYNELDFCSTWSRLWAYVKEQKLFTAGMEHICIYHDDPKVTEVGKLRTDVCLVICKPVLPKGEIGLKTIEGGRHAVFLYQGPYSNLGSVYDTIFSEWLPDSGQKLRTNACFEKYLNHPDKTVPEKLKTEIYVPIE